MVGTASFRALVQGLVQTAIQTVGDLAEDFLYQSVGTSVYDTTTGATTETVTPYNVTGIFSRFTTHEIDSKVVVATDAKLTIAYLDLPVTPNVADNITFLIGRTWKPVRIISPPGSAAWTIHIRAV